jgi:hypothetical protein
VNYRNIHYFVVKKFPLTQIEKESSRSVWGNSHCLSRTYCLWSELSENETCIVGFHSRISQKGLVHYNIKRRKQMNKL